MRHLPPDNTSNSNEQNRSRSVQSRLEQGYSHHQPVYGDSVKERLRLLLDEPSSSRTALFTAALVAIIILVSSLISILETTPSFYKNRTELWLYLESFIAGTFLVELTLRFYAHSTTFRQFRKFFFSFYTLIDLLAIMPFFVSLVFYGVGGSDFIDIQRLTVLRLFRLLRLFRCYNYSSILQLSIDALILSVRKSIDALIALVLFLSFIMVSFSTILYFAERGTWDAKRRLFIDIDGDPSSFSSIPASLWFVVEVLTTVGLGDVFPKTIMGKVITVPLMMLSLLIIALPSIVIGRNFAESWAWLRSVRPTRRPLNQSNIAPHSSTTLETNTKDIPEHPNELRSPLTATSATLLRSETPVITDTHHRGSETSVERRDQVALLEEIAQSSMASKIADLERYPMAPSTSVVEHGEVILGVLQELQRQNELLERLLSASILPTSSPRSPNSDDH